jgi:hypothetical protein
MGGEINGQMGGIDAFKRSMQNSRTDAIEPRTTIRFSRGFCFQDNLMTSYFNQHPVVLSHNYG